MEKSLDKRIHNIKTSDLGEDFILVDAKDPDAAFGIAATGFKDKSNPNLGHRSLGEFYEEIRELVDQNILDVMLTTIFTYDNLVENGDIFQNSSLTPAVRVNSSTDIWLVRGGIYGKLPSLPYSHASLENIIFGSVRDLSERQPRIDLGLYSITFSNHPEIDLRSMVAFREFYELATDLGFRYFLEVFDPNNEDCGLTAEEIPAFCNDQIARIISLTPKHAQPLFLKVPYHGPDAMQELAKYHSETIIGILGGSSGTTYDAFKLISEAQKYGAKAAIFGRRIKNSEAPLYFVRILREIVSSRLSPELAVEKYHQCLEEENIQPLRNYSEDCKLESEALAYLK
jgi:hypothetical protein